MTPWNEFDGWMLQRKNNYLNDFGVVFCRTPQLVFVDAPWPGHGDPFALSIGLICTDGKELFQILNFETVGDLEKLQPEDMLHFFYNGKAILICRIGDDEILQFQKGRDAMIAWIDGEDVAHAVQEQLIMAGDFINYTKAYFQYVNSVKEKRKKH